MTAPSGCRQGWGLGAGLRLTEGPSVQDSGGTLNDSFIVQCSQPVFLSISVVDEPDLDPQFVREFYSASVAEDAAVVGDGATALGGGCPSTGPKALTQPPPRGRRC